MDPAAAPAAELAALYGQEFETLLDELKTHQRGPRVVLRSQTPDGVRQEVWACLCVYYAIRWLMHTVALEADTDPDRLSFTRTLRVARRSTASHPVSPLTASTPRTPGSATRSSSNCCRRAACAPTPESSNA